MNAHRDIRCAKGTYKVFGMVPISVGLMAVKSNSEQGGGYIAKIKQGGFGYCLLVQPFSMAASFYKIPA